MSFSPLLRVFFHLLYHPLAFAYDAVAAVVSFGHWNQWIESMLPFLIGDRVLELGFGPGHLQPVLHERFSSVYGLDESREMVRIAKKRLAKMDDGASHRLVRGITQALPFPDNSFDCLVSSFPSEYISDDLTLSEVRRVLAPDGRIVVLPVVWPRNRLLAWLFRVTGQAPSESLDMVKERLITRFQRAGFQTDTQMIQAGSGIAMILIARAEPGISDFGI